jgi:hypothetical protein
VTAPNYRIRDRNSSSLHSAADAFFRQARIAFESDPRSPFGVAFADIGLLLQREARGIATTETDWLRALFVMHTWLEKKRQEKS